ncbi:unnamed protein product [Rotaria sp. Silwood2]|nr:unnamed protein product [Rotaria sp. Silwood2]
MSLNRTTVEQPIRSNTYRLHEFDPTSYDWNDWEILFDTYIDVEGITDDNKKRNLLITALGVQPFKTLISVCKPKKPTECSYSEIIQKLRTNYARVTFSSTERIKFFATRQESSQTLTDFANSLRDKSVTCKFPNDFYEDALIAAFVGGLKNEHVRKHLMQQNLETFEQTLNAARIFESVLIQGANVKDNSYEDAYIQEIQQIDKQSTNVHHKISCSSCGSTDHPRSKCRFRHVTCHNCNKEGHIAKVCRSQTTSNNVKINTINSVAYHQITDENPFQIPIQIDDLKVTFELDTGSPITIINEHVWKKMGKPKLTPVKSIYSSFTGHSIHLKGETMVKVVYNGQSTRLKLLVADRNRNNIIGRNWINSLHLNRIKLNDIFSNHTISNVNPKIKYIRTTSEYSQSIDPIACNVDFGKSVLKKGLHNKKKISNILSKCLYCSRTTPHSPTKLSCSDATDASITNRKRYQTNFDHHTKEHDFYQGNKVLVRDFRNHSNKVEWVPGVLIDRQGSRIWTVKVGTQLWRRYDDQIKHYQLSSDDDVIAIGPLKTTCHDTNSSASSSTSEHGSKIIRRSSRLKKPVHRLIEEI